MKNLLCVILIAFTAFSTHSFSDVITEQYLQTLKMCGEIEHLSTGIMSARQNGAPMRELMELIPDRSPMNELNSHIIMDAYDFPRYSSQEMQDRTIVEFANKWYRLCITNLK